MERRSAVMEFLAQQAFLLIFRCCFLDKVRRSLAAFVLVIRGRTPAPVACQPDGNAVRGNDESVE